ncbi:DUF1963 domain-containing protein [Armatimonas rosea]|uniref:DUF1963 domain-containing protein n=1 Tax=Armatimonas rosea TaxID=685828 RepID=A0A7W9SM98_ARMRO|nr:DUF1963 domain-containing protein [Armatimonas rosea]MBB6048955.1 hypothetical protein [Armatimonas rosea]
MALYENVRDWLLTPGDPGPLPVTKFAGVPWWPKGTPRPVCPEGHTMGFVAQVRLADVPGWESDPGLLSFHYCYECMWYGDMAFGWGDTESKSYAVTILYPTEQDGIDDLGSIGATDHKPYAVAFYDYSLPVLRREHDEVWYATLAEDDPEDAEAARERAEEEIQNFALREHYGLVHSGELPSPGLLPDTRDEGVYRADWSEFTPGSGNRSRLGGPPNWMQSAKFPINATGEPLLFVAQLDWVMANHSFYLFASPSDYSVRTGEMVFQST